MRHRLGFLYGVLVALLLTIGIWWVYYLTHEDRLRAQERRQRYETDRAFAALLLAEDPPLAADPERWLGAAFPHLEFARTTDGWRVSIDAEATRAIDERARRTRNMFLYEGLVFLVLLAAGSTILVLSVRSERRFEQARELFLAGATHELKTPLAGLRLYAETLGREDLREDDRKRIRERLVANVARLEGLVDEVLAMSAEGSFERGPSRRLDLLAEARVVVEDVRRLAAERAVTLTLAGDADATIAGARTVFAVALRNLLVNAVRHCPEPVTIAVAVSRGERWHRVAVRDDGPGIPRRLHERIFECFYSGCRERAEAPGAGIGLYLVRRNVAALGGRVELQSAEGAGSTFTMVLPAAQGT